MDELDRRKRGPLTWLSGRSRRFGVGVVVLLLPLVYLTSYPFTAWLLHQGFIPAQFVPVGEAIYSPLEWLMKYLLEFVLSS